jgi:hypothetical protein
MDRPTAVSPPTGLSLARALLVVNGAIDALSGVLMFVAAGPIASFLGIGKPLIVEAVGVVLALFGAGVFWFSLRTVSRWLVLAVVAINVMWAVDSAIVLLVGVPALSEGGRWAVEIVAVIDALFAAAQLYALRKMG